jgi:hypothetical protein
MARCKCRPDYFAESAGSDLARSHCIARRPSARARPRRMRRYASLAACLAVDSLQCVIAAEGGGAASAPEDTSASETSNGALQSGCDGKGRDKCLGDDPYYIGAMVFALTIVGCLVGAYVYCRLHDIGNIDRNGELGHLDKVVTDNYGKIILNDPNSTANKAPDIRIGGISVPGVVFSAFLVPQIVLRDLFA